MSTPNSSLGRRTGQRFSPPPQYDSCAPQLGYLSESIHRLLTERECAIFDRGLADYHRRRNIKAFVECLSLVLNTNHKRQLLIPVRDTYVKPSDISRFNQLVQVHGIATSLKRKKKEEEKQKVGEGIKKIEVKRDSNGEWGFNIRGGSEHGIGIFVSWVEPGSSAHKNSLQIGDQILKANETDFESISHYEAVQLMKSSKKLQLWVLSHGRVPGSRMAHKVYRWVDPEGRPTTPPLDPFEIMEQRARGVLNEADERKVTLMVDSGRELGLSIRGGAEHGLGIYISQVEEGSVAAVYGLKVGDQIIEVNGVNCINIVHADAANALRAQPCMVMKLKDVGKLPHSKITTYGQTQWYQSPSATITRGARDQAQDSPAFSYGAGTQMMLKKQDPAIQGRGTMKEMARSLLTAQELSTFNYYISQYEHHGLSVENLVTPLLDLLNTPEKLQLLGEVRGILRARDLNRFNELTVHREIAAKKAVKKTGGSSVDGSQSRLNEGRTMLTNFALQPSHALQTTAQLHHDEPVARQLSPPLPAEISLSAGERTLTPRTAEYGDTSSEEGEGGGRDRFPQRLSPPNQKPSTPMFHAPPPPSTPPQAHITSTPEGAQSPDPKQVLANTLKERRQWTRPGAREQSMEEEETWEGQWSLSTIQSPQRRGLEEVDSPAISEIEARVRMETEAKLRREFEEKEQRIMEEQRRLLEEQQQQKARALQAERKALERQMRETEERTKQELEARIRREAEEEMRRQLAQRERQIAEEQEQRMLEEQHRREELEREALEQEIRQAEERTKQELEEKIWKEAEEHIRLEFEARMQQEKEQLVRQSTQKHRADEQVIQKAQERARREAEEKYRVEFEQKMQKEMQKRKREEDAERRQREEEERQQREAEIARLEAEEQARIEQEERIRAEVEAKVRAEYEARLQRETEERARLATEVKVHKAAEERMEQQRREREEAEQSRKQEMNVQRAADERMAQQRREREEAEQRRKQEMNVQRAADERMAQQRREREEAKQRRKQEVKAPLTAAERMEQQRRDRDEAEQRQLQEEQHRIQAAHEEEERRREEEQRQAEEEEQRKMEADRKRKQELERKREENIHKREEERRQKELEQRKKKGKGKLRKQEEEQRKQQEEEERRRRQQEAEDEERRRQEAEQQKQEEAEREQRKQREAERKAAHTVQQVRVRFEDEGERPKRLAKSRGQLIEDERKRAEEKLQRRLEREKIRRTPAEKITSTPQETERADAQQESPTSEPEGATGSGPSSFGPSSANERLLPNANEKSFGGYTNLRGEILTVTITKVCRKLGIAIDGGANTKQKAVIIREISPGGCAALTGTGLSVGQQILQVSGTDLSGLKHKDVVMTIKSSFEGPLNKTLEFVVLEQEADD